MDEELKNEEMVDETPKAESIEATVETPDEESIGNVKISVDVVSTIAGIATMEIEGVSCMYISFAGGIKEMFTGSKKNASKGVKVVMNEDSVLIDLYIVVDYGVRIPELSWEVQENVKNNVETMTGLEVEKVNIHIEGVSFESEEQDIAEIVEEPEVLPDAEG